MIKQGDQFNTLYSIDENIYNGFINVFQDKNILHTNEEYATKKGFKGCVMHGNILSGLISNFVGERLPFKNVIIHKQEIKFKNAVYLNDELELNVITKQVIESVNVIVFDFLFSNSNNDIVAQGKIQIGLI